MTQPASLTQDERPDLTPPRGVALLVDDELSNRVVLGALLKKMGYQIIQAVDGAQAVNLFRQEQPDIVFMDVMMPVMDGLEATSLIKGMCSDHFVPVIFLTALTDEKALVRCIEVGGDDFLTKPFSHTVLRSKIQAMERIRDLHREISKLYGQQQQEQEIAEKVFNGAVLTNNVDTDQIHVLLRPATLFSGDVLLTAFTPTGDLHVLLGDFTGHGLYAALGALPVSEVFRTMTSKGFAIEQILNEINRKLQELLPTGMFLAANMLSISNDLENISLCNCGMPDALILDAAASHIKRRIASRSLPLGIMPSGEFRIPIEQISADSGERIVLLSDGVLEARNPNGEQFGTTRLKRLLKNIGNKSLVQAAEVELKDFCQDAEQDDDISMVEIELLPALVASCESIPAAHTETYPLTEMPVIACSRDAIEFSLTLQGPKMLHTNPVPLLISQIQELEDLQSHRRALFTILSELYVNALDHGVLGLDSSLKQQADGFTRYFEERERALNELSEGEVSISIRSQLREKGGEVIIRVEDSGPGFDFVNILEEINEGSNTAPCGRGLLLVKELCAYLRYEQPGNKAEVVYRWSE
jgi:CheY-like chemotaxis protein/anti-sigma regulatory factor (Ser/Thr protein kinase)